MNNIKTWLEPSTGLPPTARLPSKQKLANKAFQRLCKFLSFARHFRMPRSATLRPTTANRINSKSKSSKADKLRRKPPKLEINANCLLRQTGAAATPAAKSTSQRATAATATAMVTAAAKTVTHGANGANGAPALDSKYTLQNR